MNCLERLLYAAYGCCYPSNCRKHSPSQVSNISSNLRQSSRPFSSSSSADAWTLGRSPGSGSRDPFPKSFARKTSAARHNSCPLRCLAAFHGSQYTSPSCSSSPRLATSWPHPSTSKSWSYQCTPAEWSRRGVRHWLCRRSWNIDWCRATLCEVTIQNARWLIGRKMGKTWSNEVLTNGNGCKRRNHVRTQNPALFVVLGNGRVLKKSLMVTARLTSLPKASFSKVRTETKRLECGDNGNRKAFRFTHQRF